MHTENRLDSEYAEGHTLGMSGIARFSKPTKGQSDASVDPRSQKIADAIRTLLSALSAPEQERVLREITAAIHPIAAPRAGKVLGTIVRLLPRRSEWTVRDIKHNVASEGVQATSKEIFNSLGYLTRKGHIRRVGYGRYLVAGGMIVTSDDLGGEPMRNEDD